MILAPRAYVHPDRYGPRKTKGANRLFVLHTTEGPEGYTSAEQLASAVGRPGDREVIPGQPQYGMFGSSYHYVTDTDRVIPLVPEDTVSYSAPGANSDGIHIVFPGVARQSPAQWVDTVSALYLRQAASILVERGPALNIPLRRLSVADVQAGKAGYCDHYTITLAYGRSDHTDVGVNFPWTFFESLLAVPAPPQPTQEHTVRTFFIVKGDPHGVVVSGITSSDAPDIADEIIFESSETRFNTYTRPKIHGDGSVSYDPLPGFRVQTAYAKPAFGGCVLDGPLPPGWVESDVAVWLGK